MSSKPKNPIHESLIAAIQRKVPANPSPPIAAIEQPRQEPAKSEPRAKPVRAKRRIGSPAQFWLHDEDKRILRELAAWLSGQGVRLTDSLVVRAALRSARTGDEFLKAFHEAAELDGRLKKYKVKSV
jgi:hypothetical protein